MIREKIRNMTKPVKVALIAAIILAAGGGTAFAAIEAGEDRPVTVSHTYSSEAVSTREVLQDAVNGETAEQAGNTGIAGNSVNAEAASGTDIGAQKAQELALAQVPGATLSHIYKTERDYDDGRLEYDIEIVYNGYEYDFEISGTDETILKSEKEREERD